MEFKVPSMIPQDLQIIQDIVGELPLPPVKNATLEPSPQDNADDSLDSSDNGSDADSEEEVEADILGQLDSEEESTPPTHTSQESTNDSESSPDSESGSENEAPYARKQLKIEELAMDDDEEGGAVVSPDQVRTKNEVANVSVVVPDVEQIGDHEKLEKVGEIFSIVDKVVIVKGLPQQVLGRVSDRALDSDTLLVFEDRKVLGYIWETFGPTAQPFYRVQFSEAYPLDSEKVRIAREVYHVPTRSKFISVSFLKQYRGSDASNAHDEEPAEEELEFSDDEAEREHKRGLKDKRTGIDPASRQATPIPSQQKDMDMSDDLYGMSPYGSYNDQDLHAGPSRPPPIAYDDPYSESYGLPDPSLPKDPPSAPEPTAETVSASSFQPDRPRGRGRGRGGARDGTGRDRERSRGRDRPRDRGRGRGRGRGGGGGERDSWGSHTPQQDSNTSEGYDSRSGRALSPTSAAIARATGQYSGDAHYPTTHQGNSNTSISPLNSSWGYQQYSTYGDYSYEYQQPFVQPHINPRFASQFGMNVAYAQPMQYAGYGQYGMGYVANGNMPNNEWTVPAHNEHSSDGQGDGQGGNANHAHEPS